MTKINLDNYCIAGGEQNWPEDHEERKELLDQIATRWESNQIFAGDDFLVFDIGQELFGRFHSVVAAAKAVRESNPSWWASGPDLSPNPETGEWDDVEFED